MSGGRTGLDELERLEAGLKLEEVAHFRRAEGRHESFQSYPYILLLQ